MRRGLGALRSADAPLCLQITITRVSRRRGTEGTVQDICYRSAQSIRSVVALALAAVRAMLRPGWDRWLSQCQLLRQEESREVSGAGRWFAGGVVSIPLTLGRLFPFLTWPHNNHANAWRTPPCYLYLHDLIAAFSALAAAESSSSPPALSYPAVKSIRFQPRGLSRLSDHVGYGRSVRGVTDQTECECAIVRLRTTFYIVMRHVKMTTVEKTHDTI